MAFEFATAGRIVFGPGSLKEVAPWVRERGRRVLVVTGRSVERVNPLLDRLAEVKVEAVVFSVAGEPSTETVSDGVARARAEGCELVVGMGGGSALDAAKAIAALLTNGGELLDYLEVIGGGKAIGTAPAPCVAVPTTSGTGAEVTRNAVLASKEHRVKVSLRSPLMLPGLAVVDPELTLGLPRSITASTGLDALTQLIEPYVSCRANPMTDRFCLEGMGRVVRSLRRAWEVPDDLEAREGMSLASLFGGLSLANAGLGAVHGFAAPVGGMFTAPHGAVCAAMLPVAMEVNIRALRERGAGLEGLKRYDEVARVLTGRAGAVAAEGVEWVRELTAALEIPGLGFHGVTKGDLDELNEKGAAASSMKANPIVLTREERAEILERSL